MGWQFDNRGLAHIHTLESAARHWAEQKPWRGKEASWRQLDGRRAFHKRIVKLSNDYGYELTLHQMPMVTYYTNTDIALRVYDSASSVDFAWYVRPDGFNVKNHAGTMYWGVLTSEGMKYVRPAHNSLIVKPLSNGNYEITSPVIQDSEWKLDLKKAAAVRKKLSHYDAWQKITAKMTGTSMFRNYVDRSALQRILDNPTAIEEYTYLNRDAPRIFCPPPVATFLHVAYELEGARYKVPVPMGELPRIQR
jgi:hypothetical protein